MPIDKTKLLDFARQLAQTEDEVQLRTAVSKAYYYAYHDCMTWMQSLPGVGLAATNGGVHLVLASRLKSLQQPCTEADRKRGKQKAYALASLKEKRTMADYHLGASVTQSLAEEAIADAQRIAVF